ncbi:hypothetical protein [Halorussus halophilus]|uniref:hypothetical protein n=1 Tax=Halorussus halophilus TaxID=2650975 RepID=UPI0013012FEC|nr:hypothetical protein [Halorussus halophilus]
MDPAYFVIGGGLLSIYCGFYVRQYPDGRWSRLATSRTEPVRGPDTQQRMERSAPLVGGVLIAVGITLILVAAVDLLSRLLGI